MLSKKLLIWIITWVVWIGWVWAWYITTQNKTPNQTGVSVVNNNWTVDIFANNEEINPDLLNKQKQQEEELTNKPNSNLSLLAGVKTKKDEKVEQSSHNFFVLNTLTIQDKTYIDTINNYIDTLKINGYNTYAFYELTNWGLWDNGCTVKFNGGPQEKMSIFSTINKFSFTDTLVNFNNISKKNKSIKLFILWDTINENCNREEVINNLQSLIGTDNNNIFVIWLNKEQNAGRAEQVTKEDIFFNNLSIKTGIQYLKVKNAGKLSEILNARIYPIQSGNWNLLQEGINAELLFFDTSNNPTAAMVSVYHQKWSTFIKQWEYTNDSITQLALVPWTYYFEIRDISSNMIIKTEQTVINSTQKFKKSFYFRKTKLASSVKNEAGKAVLANYEIYDTLNGNYLLKEQKWAETFNFELSPWKYKLKVKTNNKFQFEEDILVEGQWILNFDFKEEQRKLKVNVKNSDGTIKQDVLVKVYTMEWDNIFSLQWWEVETVLWAWSYKVEAIDINSSSKVNRNANVSSVAPTTTIELTFRTAPTILDVGKNPLMIRIYDKKTYDAYPKDSVEKQKIALRSISWSWKLKLNLFPWEYAVDMFNINWQIIWSKSFYVWDFDDNNISLEDAIRWF